MENRPVRRKGRKDATAAAPNDTRWISEEEEEHKHTHNLPTSKASGSAGNKPESPTFQSGAPVLKEERRPRKC